jgi:aspartyl/asparaginyl beta-hydroxylase (cupin superfamily)
MWRSIEGLNGAMAGEAQAEDLVRAAMAARQRGDAGAERALLDEAATAAPGNPLVRNARGMRALADRDFALAAASFEAAHAADPAEPALLMNLATARRGLGDAAAERTALELVEQLDRTHFTAQLRLAEWHERQGDPVLAAEYWRHVLALAPADDTLPPALVERVSHARSFVAAANADFAARLNEGLAGQRQLSGAPALRRFDACMAHMMGERRIYQNDCSGLHYPFLPADEFFERRHFPWMAELEARTDAIRAEFLALQAEAAEAIRPYVRQEKGTPANKWSTLDNRLDWGACFLWEYGEPNAPVLERCPETAKALAALPRNHIPGRAPTAFFSLLKPRTRIPAHTGVTNTRAIIHLPLIVPEGCGFRVGGETRVWKPGEAFGFDDTIEHEAWNDSDELRVVLIFDVWNPHLSEEEQALLVQFFGSADSSGHNAAARREKA